MNYFKSTIQVRFKKMRVADEGGVRKNPSFFSFFCGNGNNG